MKALNKLYNVLLKLLFLCAIKRSQKLNIIRKACNLFEKDSASHDAVEIIENAFKLNTYYSQEGEDIILERLLKNKSKGFYVDIGAHHAKRFSNTYHLYLKGWRGINVDATPGSMQSFEHYRAKDINLEAAISDQCEALTFYMFEEKALNTFDRKIAEEYTAIGHPIISTKLIETTTLAKILDDHIPENTSIDLLTIDVEGKDLEVLQSNNWKKYIPKIIIIEILNAEIKTLHEHPIILFLQEHQYSLTSKLYNSIILERR